MADVIELEFPARAQYLSLARVLLSAISERGPVVEGTRLDDLRLAVSEACANAIDAYAGQRKGGERVRVRLTIEADRLEVEVSDHAGGFDPLALRPHPPPTVPARLQFERGLGIPLMKALTDEVEFRAADGGTAVRLVVHARR